MHGVRDPINETIGASGYRAFCGSSGALENLVLQKSLPVERLPHSQHYRSHFFCLLIYAEHQSRMPSLRIATGKDYRYQVSLAPKHKTRKAEMLRTTLEKPPGSSHPTGQKAQQLGLKFVEENSLFGICMHTG